MQCMGGRDLGGGWKYKGIERYLKELKEYKRI